MRSAVSAVSQARRGDESLVRLRGDHVNLGGRALWQEAELAAREAQAP